MQVKIGNMKISFYLSRHYHHVGSNSKKGGDQNGLKGRKWIIYSILHRYMIVYDNKGKVAKSYYQNSLRIKRRASK